MRIQLYLALIGAVLVALWTGKRPIEQLQFYFMGWATINDVMRRLHRPPPRKKPKVALAGYRPA